MSSQISPKSAVDKGPGLLPSVLLRVAICAVWAPLLVLVAVYVPRFEDLFARLREMGELPAVTAWLSSLSRLNDALFYLPCLVFLVLLVVADAGAARLLPPSRRGRSLYWVWFAAVGVTGILGAGLVLAALLLPVMRMSATL